MNSDKTAV